MSVGTLVITDSAAYYTSKYDQTLLKLAEISQEGTRIQRWTKIRAIGQTQKPVAYPERLPYNTYDGVPVTMVL